MVADNLCTREGHCACDPTVDGLTSSCEISKKPITSKGLRAIKALYGHTFNKF